MTFPCINPAPDIALSLLRKIYRYLVNVTTFRTNNLHFRWFKSSGYARLEPKYIRFYKSELVEMIKIGLPSGLQGCMFSLSNVLIQSTVNSYGKLFMSGNTAAGQVEGYIYNTCNAISLTALAFVSQNYGAKKPDRIRKVVKETLAVVVCIAVVLSALAIAFSDVLCGLFCSGEEPLAVARTRMIIVGGSYILCGVMDVMGNVMRGLNKSTTAMVVSLSGSCLFRILWVNSFYLLNPCKEMLYVVVDHFVRAIARIAI